MSYRRPPDVIAFDVIGTLFDLNSLKPRLAAGGLHPELLQTWFGRVLRDAFALDATGVYRPFEQVAAGTLTELMAEHGTEPHARRLKEVLAGFGELDAYPDVMPALTAARDAGVRVIALTNGSAANTAALLDRAGAAPLDERAVSIDDVKHWKPRAEVYEHAAAACGVATADLAVVAAHGWDVQGASRAGLRTGYVVRERRAISPAMATPDHEGDDLTALVEAMTVR